MFKRLAPLLLALLLVLPGCGSKQNAKAPNKEETDLIKYLKTSTAQLVNITKEGKYFPYCSGVWVSDRHLLTAYHCVEREPKTTQEALNKIFENKDPDVVGSFVKLRTYGQQDGDEHSIGMVMAVKTNKDLALISAVDPSLEHTVVRISPLDIHAGTTAHIVGHPRSYPYSYVKGYVSGVRENEAPFPGFDVKVLQIASPAWKGYSGGGAFDENGRLMGTCSFVKMQGPLLSFFIHKDEVIKFLDDERISYLR